MNRDSGRRTAGNNRGRRDETAAQAIHGHGICARDELLGNNKHILPAAARGCLESGRDMKAAPLVVNNGVAGKTCPAGGNNAASQVCGLRGGRAGAAAAASGQQAAQKQKRQRAKRAERCPARGVPLAEQNDVCGFDG